ncbi:MAG: hypothetical protein ACXVA9_00535 [Bdellovibrionales bacterium]
MNSILFSLLTISCSYQIYGAPYAAVAFSIFDDGRLDNSAQITMTGAAMHKETLTADTAKSDEFVHAWISKESPQNQIELIIYNSPQPQGRSKIVNNQVPFGKEMWGDCTGLP